MAFKISTQPESGRLAVSLSGNVDEDAGFTPLDLGANTQIVFDLEGVTAINSVGIREWIKWIKTLPASVKMAVRKCPKIIVDQINMVAGFLPPGTQVESFYVPYYSDASGSEKMVLFQYGKEYKDGKIEFPAEIKDDSGEVMEMDVIEAKYFKFLTNG